MPGEPEPVRSPVRSHVTSLRVLIPAGNGSTLWTMMKCHPGADSVSVKFVINAVKVCWTD